MFINRCYDKSDIGSSGVNAMNDQVMNCPNNCCPTCQPIMECPQERVCHRQMCYEVPQG